MPPLNSDTQFERTLADLAFASLQDKAPVLLDYLVGFQVLDSDEDQSRAIGVFGAKIGKEWLYIPVWFMNGELRDGLIYLKNQDIFVPQTEAWIQYIMNRRPYKLGEGTDTTMADLAGQGADIMQFKTSPEGYGKTAGVIESPPTAYLGQLPCWKHTSLQPWAGGIRERLGHNPYSGEFCKAAEKLDLMYFLSHTSPAFVSAFVDTMLKEASLANAVLKFYPVEQLTSLKFAAVNDKDLDKNYDPDEDGPNKVEIIRYDRREILGGNPATLTDKERSDLMAGKIVIRDHRNNTSSVYKTSIRQSVQTPNETGIWNVVTRDAQLVQCLAIVSPIYIGHNDTATIVKDFPEDRPESLKRQSQDMELVNMDGPGRWKGKNDQVFADPCKEHPFGMSQAISKFKDVASCVEKQCYVIVSPCGAGTECFRVAKKREMSDGTVHLFVSPKLNLTLEDYANWSTMSKILYNPEYHGKLTKIGGTVFCGAECKAAPVSLDGNRHNYGLTEPASPREIEHILWRLHSHVPLKIYSSGSEYEITIGTGSGSVKASNCGAVEALGHLSRTMGINCNTAHEMLKEADANRRKGISTRYVIKMASGYPNFEKSANPMMGDPYLTGMGPTAPSPMVDPTMMSDASLGVPVTTGNSQEQAIAGMDQDNSPLYDPNPQLDTMPHDVINQASQLGQKEIFDTAVIGSLVNTIESDDLVDKYLGDLIMGMDRVGRIYFLFMQHNDDFRERYGEEDLLELEDNLRNTFNMIGDLILMLKQKTVEQGAETDRTEIV